MGSSGMLEWSLYALPKHRAESITKFQIFYILERKCAMKKKILVCAFIAICLSVLAYSSLAYFTYEDKATNVITMGNIKIELQQLRDGSPTPNNEEIVILPGLNVEKTVQIKNVGDYDAWIRISVSEAIELANGTKTDNNGNLIGYDFNTESWIEKDGYYYYTSILAPGKTTEPLFTTISFADQMGNEYQESKAYVNLSAEATQVVHNGETVFEAAGWPSAE